MGSTSRPNIFFGRARPDARFAQLSSFPCPMTRVRMSGWTSIYDPSISGKKKFDIHFGHFCNLVVFSFSKNWRFWTWSPLAKMDVLDMVAFGGNGRFGYGLLCRKWSFLPIGRSGREKGQVQVPLRRFPELSKNCTVCWPKVNINITLVKPLGIGLEMTSPRSGRTGRSLVEVIKKPGLSILRTSVPNSLQMVRYFN